MLDRTDLQLMLCEAIMGADNDDLIELANHLIGCDLTPYNESSEVIVGSVESISIDDPQGVEEWLVFLQHALGQRVRPTW